MCSCAIIPCRYITAFVLFLFLTLNYMIRVDINITILSMVNDTSDDMVQLNHTSICGPVNITNQAKEHSIGTYTWSRPIQGLILGAFFWGYIVVQIPGGLLAHHFGPRWLGLVCILGSAITDLCLPSAAALGWAFLIVCRAIQGLFQGPMLPINACLIGRWVPPNERSRFTAFVYAGTQIGTVLGQSVAGALSQVREWRDPHSELMHYISYWPYVHYLFGGLGLLFALIWLGTVHDEPSVHPHISSAEREYLHTCLMGAKEPVDAVKTARSSSDQKMSEPESLKSKEEEDHGEENEPNRNSIGRTKKHPVPWSHILTSLPVLAILVCHMTYNWAWYSLITCMPTYMARVLGFDMFDNGLLSSVPYVVQCLVAQVVAQCSDVLITRHLLTVTWVRKLNNLIALGGVGAGLLAVGYLGCQRIGAVILLATTIGLMGFASSGYSANTVDLAPKFAGNIISVTNTMATLPGIFGPMLVGYMTRDSSRIGNWRIVFGVSTGLAWFGALVNLMLTSGEVQPWAQPSTTIDALESDREVLPADQ